MFVGGSGRARSLDESQGRKDELVTLPSGCLAAAVLGIESRHPQLLWSAVVALVHEYTGLSIDQEPTSDVVAEALEIWRLDDADGKWGVGLGLDVFDGVGHRKVGGALWYIEIGGNVCTHGALLLVRVVVLDGACAANQDANPEPWDRGEDRHAALWILGR